MTQLQTSSDLRPAGQLTVLVADDQAPARSVVTRLLESEGHRVLEAADGERAWQLFQERQPDLVVSDIRMPGMDGVELLQKIRKVSPQTEVILITGFAEVELVVGALRNGASNFVEKPFRPRDLLRQLEPSFARCALALEAQRLETELNAERRRREIQDRMATMGRLLAGLAHELHNPLTYLKGNVEILRVLLARLTPETGPGAAGSVEEVRTLLDDMEFGAHRIQELIAAMKRFGTPPRIEKSRVPLARLMANAEKLARTSKSNRVELRLDAPPPEILVEVEPIELESCFVNLLVNAYEALGDEGGRVTFSADLLPFETSAFQGLVDVTVEDDGPGIPQGLVDEVFTPFFTRKNGGTGLGLSLAYEAAKRNGAQLEIHSDGEDQGARVVTRLSYLTEGWAASHPDPATGAAAG